MADELAESLQDDKTITVVEWGDIAEEVLPADRITIEFKPIATDTDERQIIFSYPESLAGLIRQLETAWIKIEP